MFVCDIIDLKSKKKKVILAFVFKILKYVAVRVRSPP